MTRKFNWLRSIVLLALLLGLVPVPGNAAPPAPVRATDALMMPVILKSWEPVAAVAAAPGPELLQFRSGDHLLGFTPQQAYFISGLNMLSIAFVDAQAVTPQAHNAPQTAPGEAAPSLDAGRIIYTDLWPGVDLEYVAPPGGLAKSTYTVAPGADPAAIRLRYNRPVELQSDGALKIAFEQGYLREAAPIAWQDIDDERVPVAVSFQVEGEVSFRVGAYDPHYPLVIDPAIEWYTYYGATGVTVNALALDTAQNLYVAGSNDVDLAYSHYLYAQPPITPLHTISMTGGTDTWIARYAAADGALQWHTYYGGPLHDGGAGIAVQSSAIYVTGYSDTTWEGDASQAPLHAHSGGGRDLFVMRLTTDGAYRWHTFYGGAADDDGAGIAVQTNGDMVYIVGTSAAAWTGPTGQAPLNAYTGGQDVVALKLNYNGVYQWHTFYGDAGDDVGRGVGLDSNLNLYVLAHSDTAWSGAAALHAHGGNGNDTAVLKLNRNGVYQWHTFRGGGPERADSIAVDAAGNVYVASATTGWAPTLNNHLFKLNSAGAVQWERAIPENRDWRVVAADDVYAPPLRVALGDAAHIYLSFGGGHDYGWRNVDIQAWDDAGVLQWEKSMTELSSYTMGNCGGLAAAGSTVYAAGNIPGFYSISQSPWLLRLNDGDLAWYKRFQITADASDYVSGIAVDADGNVYLSGLSITPWLGDDSAAPLHAHSGPDAALDDLFVLKLDRFGAYQWHTFYGPVAAPTHASINRGDNEFDLPLNSGIAVDPTGNVYVAAATNISWTNVISAPLAPLGPPTTTTLSLVLLKLDSAGAYQWHTYPPDGYAVFPYGEDIFKPQGGPFDMATDADGNVYVTGGTIEYGGSYGHYRYTAHITPGLTLKLNSAGETQWTAPYGGFGLDVDANGNVYLAGSGGHVGYIPYTTGRKLDADGQLQWTYEPDDVTIFLDVAVDRSGGVYFTGAGERFSTEPPLNPFYDPDTIYPSEHMLVLKLNAASGDYEWHTYSGSLFDDVVYDGLRDPEYFWGKENTIGTRIATDANNNVYVVGPTNTSVQLLKLSSAGDRMWEEEYIRYPWAGKMPSMLAVTPYGAVYAGEWTYGLEAHSCNYGHFTPIHYNNGGPDILAFKHGNVVGTAVVTFTESTPGTPYLALDDTITLRLTLQNTEPVSDSNVVLTYTIAADAVLDEWILQPAGANHADGVITWSGPLAPGEVVEMIYRLRHTGGYNRYGYPGGYNRYVGGYAYVTGQVVDDGCDGFGVYTPPPPPPTLVKTVVPTQTIQGDGATLTYTIVFTQNAVYSMTEAYIMDDALAALLTDIQVVSSTLPLSTEPPLTSTSPYSPYNVIQHYGWRLPEVLPGTTHTITLTGVLSPGVRGIQFNQAVIAGKISAIAVQGSDSVSITIRANPEITKTAGDLNGAPLLPGDLITYGLHVTNVGIRRAITDVIVTDTLPAGVTLVGATPADYTGGKTLTWTIASLAPGATWAGIVTVSVNAGATEIGGNWAGAAAPLGGQALVGPIYPPDGGQVASGLTITKTAQDRNGTPLETGDVLRYEIQVDNTHATLSMTNVLVTDTLPSGVTLVSASPAGYAGPNPLTWAVAEIAPNGAWRAVVTVTVNSGVAVIGGNVAAVASDQQNAQEVGPICPPEGCTVQMETFALSKTAKEMSAPPLLVNDRILYTIRVTNTTTGTLTGLVITDTLPAGVTFFEVPKGPSRPFTRDGQQVVWTRGPLAAGASLTLQVIGKVDGTVNPIGWNHVAATCAEETTLITATAQVAGDGIHEPGLVITGTVGGGNGMLAVTPFATQAGQWVYAVTLTNTNPTHTMHNVSISVTLPSGVTLVGATPPGYTGAVTLTWTLPTLGPGAVWQGSITVEQTGPVGEMLLATASDEQDPVEAVVAALNQPPVAMDDTFSEPENVPGESLSALDVLANDTDPDGDPITLTHVSAPLHGVTTISATLGGGIIIYTPTLGYTGTDSFTYIISDGLLTATARVTVSVWPAADLEVEQTVRGTISGLDFIIVARNYGPRGVNGARLVDTFPPILGNLHWRCAAANGAVCAVASGVGHLDETLSVFPSGGVLTYTVSTVVLDNTQLQFNTVEIIAPAGFYDLQPANNVVTRQTLYRLILPIVYRNYMP